MRETIEDRRNGGLAQRREERKFWEELQAFERQQEEQKQEVGRE